jgi:hypothetical protein
MVPSLPQKPWEFKGDVLGVMTLDQFKTKYARKVTGHNEMAPWCSDSRPESHVGELLSEEYFSRAVIVHGRLDFPFERTANRPGPTVAGVETLNLIYQFVDNKLFGIIALIPGAGIDTVYEAIVAKYGEPISTSREASCWSNAVCEIRLLRPRRRVKISVLQYVHLALTDLADSRRPGPAVHDL